MLQTAEYEDGVPLNSTWGEGDWNCDGDFDTQDIVKAFIAGGYSIAALSAPLPSPFPSPPVSPAKQPAARPEADYGRAGRGTPRAPRRTAPPRPLASPSRAGSALATAPQIHDTVHGWRPIPRLAGRAQGVDRAMRSTPQRFTPHPACGHLLPEGEGDALGDHL